MGISSPPLSQTHFKQLTLHYCFIATFNMRLSIGSTFFHRLFIFYFSEHLNSLINWLKLANCYWINTFELIIIVSACILGVRVVYWVEHYFSCARVTFCCHQLNNLNKCLFPVTIMLFKFLLRALLFHSCVYIRSFAHSFVRWFSHSFIAYVSISICICIYYFFLFYFFVNITHQFLLYVARVSRKITMK